jgi:hypothetical protein
MAVPLADTPEHVPPPSALAARPAPDPVQAAIVRNLDRSRLLIDEPWRADLEPLLRLCESFAQSPKEALQEQYIALAKAHLIAPEDAIAGAYVLFGNDRAMKVFAGILQQEPAERVRLHNAYVINELGPVWLTQYGTCLKALHWPLFPPTPELSTLNTILLREAKGACVSGGATRTRPDVYRREDVSAVEGGAPFAPVICDNAGNAFVDLADPHSAVTDLQRRVQAIERHGDFSRRGRGQQDRGERGRGQRGRARERWHPRGGEPAAEKDFSKVEGCGTSTLK